MRKLDPKGIAAIPLVVIIAVSTGAAMATPVIVDAVDVDPDSPFYGLERLGETMRMVGSEDQMKERWGEYARAANRGGGLAYRHILEEFVQKMQEVVPGDVATKQEIVQWMQEQMPGRGLVRLRLARELAEGLQEDIPEAGEEIENEIGELEHMEQEISTASPELLENINARLHLIMDKLENIAERYGSRVHKPVDVYINIDNSIADANVTANVEATINVILPPVFSDEFNLKLRVFENELAEIMLKLEIAPENTHGKHAAKRLVERAIELKNRAIQNYNEGRTRKALGLIHAANRLLRNAERILDNASEWESAYSGEWEEWSEQWDNLKQEWTVEGTWGNIIEDWSEQLSNVGYEGLSWENTRLSRRGVIHKPEMTAWMYGTHLLLTSDNTHYALISATINLDEFVGREVTVEGTVLHSGIDFGPTYLNVTSVGSMATAVTNI